MLIEPYKTTVCSHYDVERILSAIGKASVLDPLVPVTTPSEKTVINGFAVPPNDAFRDVPGFTQCVRVPTKNKQGKDEFQWVVDGRPFMRIDKQNQSYRLVTENDYTFQAMRLSLTQTANSDKLELISHFNQLGDIPIKVFVRWITGTLTSLYNLPIEQQVKVAVITAYYYYTQISENRKLSEDDVIGRSKFVARTTFVTQKIAMDIGLELPPMEDLTGFVKALNKHAGVIRLESLKVQDIFARISSTWVGTHARETACVALEHIPTFMAMVFAAMDDRSYRKTILTSLVERAGTQTELKQFRSRLYDTILLGLERERGAHEFI